MKKTEVFTELCQHLSTVLCPRGFKLRKRARDFVRSGNDVKQSVLLPFWDYNPEFHFSLLFGFRVEAVESLYHLFSGVDPKYQATTDTCNVNLEALTQVTPDWIEVHDVPSIREGVSRLIPLLERDVFPFLDSHQDLASLDRMMNGPDRDRLVITAEPSPSMHALILAHLNDNPKFDRLITAYRKKLERGCCQEDMAEYEALVEHLQRLRSFDRAWRTPTVLGLARAASDNRSRRAGTLEPDRLSVLADALEDAGCANQDILAHLRESRRRVRESWVLDAILGKG
jgi:hypothetical protein